MTQSPQTPKRTNWKSLATQREGRIAELESQLASANTSIQGRDDQLTATRRELRLARRDALSMETVREEIFQLSRCPTNPPNWVLSASATKSSGSIGVPTLFWSDWHWGEVVKPEQVNHVNAYSFEIGWKRCQYLVERSIKFINASNYTVPGVVIALGGDMVSGDIHEELSRSNDGEMMVVVQDLKDKLVWAIQTMADEYGRVFIPCVAGNHGRTTRKPMHKSRNHTNFDWLLYNMLRSHFNGVNPKTGEKGPNYDDRVHFLIPEGADAFYEVFGHRYLLTHGDNIGARGGDGEIGAIGPIVRGAKRTKAQHRQLGRIVDTIMMGHWHQYMHLDGIIVNGSLKGYDEFASNLRFGIQPPAQAMWWTHPVTGIGTHLEILCEPPKEAFWSSDQPIFGWAEDGIRQETA